MLDNNALVGEVRDIIQGGWTSVLALLAVVASAGAPTLVALVLLEGLRAAASVVAGTRVADVLPLSFQRLDAFVPVAVPIL